MHMHILPQLIISAKIPLGSCVQGTERRLAKSFHRYTHAPKSEEKTLLRDAGIENEKLEEAYEHCYDINDISTS